MKRNSYFCSDDSANGKSSKLKHTNTQSDETGKQLMERVCLFSKRPPPQSISIIEFNEFVEFSSMETLSVWLCAQFQVEIT